MMSCALGSLTGETDFSSMKIFSTVNLQVRYLVWGLEQGLDSSYGIPTPDMGDVGLWLV